MSVEMDREILESFLNQKVELVKDNDFVEYGIITGIFNNAISFYIRKQHRTIYLTFDRIKEIRPLGGNNDF